MTKRHTVHIGKLRVTLRDGYYVVTPSTGGVTYGSANTVAGADSLIRAVARMTGERVPDALIELLDSF